MIIRCPECSTGFELPDERVTPEGTKLKCSRCEHIFRVREDDDGEPEIFYQPHDNEGDDQGSEQEDEDGKSPFPHSGGLDLKPKKKGAFGDLGGGGSSPFDGDDSQEEVAQSDEDVEESDEVPDHEKATILTDRDQKFGDPEEHVDDSFGEEGPVFDPEQGKVDPGSGSAAVATATKPTTDKKVSPGKPKKKGGGPPAGAVGPPPTAAKKKSPTESASASAAVDDKQDAASTAPATTPQPADSPIGWDDDELEPHNIGGGMGTKVVTFLFLLSLVAMGFAGVVAYLNDGFLDFQAPGEMIEVAFGDGEYEPRAEWSEDRPETIVMEASDPVSVEGVHGELVSVGGGDHLYVVQGMVRNNQDSRIYDVELRATIFTPEERRVRDAVGIVGDGDASIGEFRALRSLDDLDELLSDDSAIIEAGDLRPFTVVFEEVPEMVVDGERFTHRVEVTSSGGGDS